MDEKVLSRLFALLSVAVTLVWLIGYLAPLWRPDYQPAPELNIVMMAIVGIFVSLYTKVKHPKDRGKEDDE